MKLFAWDFHGVLEKDNEHAVQEVINQVFREFRIKKNIGIEKIREHYGLRFAEYYRTLLPDYKEERILELVNRSVEIGPAAASKYIKPMDYAEEVLKKIRETGNRNIVVSNCGPEVMKFFLDSVGLTSLIDDYFGLDKERGFIISKSKTDSLREYLLGKDFKRIIMTGDSEQDIEAGLACSAITYLFVKNKHPKKHKTKAHYIINDLREVLREI